MRIQHLFGWKFVMALMDVARQKSLAKQEFGRRIVTADSQAVENFNHLGLESDLGCSAIRITGTADFTFGTVATSCRTMLPTIKDNLQVK